MQEFLTALILLILLWTWFRLFYLLDLNYSFNYQVESINFISFFIYRSPIHIPTLVNYLYFFCLLNYLSQMPSTEVLKHVQLTQKLLHSRVTLLWYLLLTLFYYGHLLQPLCYFVSENIYFLTFFLHFILYPLLFLRHLTI